KTPPRAVLGIIQRWKDRGLTPDRVSVAEGATAMNGLALDLYRAYQERLLAVNAVDFGDLMLHCLTVFRADPNVLSRYQNQFRYLLVDEYQDTNVAQYLWLRALAQAHHNICCVGDDDQSIYSWRGAEVGNILRFEEDFPGARVVRLEHNYRSTPHILAAASGLIANNESRLGKTLRTHLNEGEKVMVRGTWDGEDEARFVSGEIEALHGKGGSLKEMAVLVRAGFQTREFEERFVATGIPYRVVGGLRFYERLEIRDAVAYLRLVVQPDDDLAFERIVNVPKRGLGAATLRNIHLLARAERSSLAAAASRLVETDELKPAARRTLRRFLESVARWRGLVDVMKHADLVAQILDESGYIEMWQLDRSPEAPGRLENLKELVAAISEFENLGSFLEHISLVMENDEAVTDEKVTLMTLHGAKGLEFDTVFLPGWEKGLFPHQRALDEGGVIGLEEERRLAYVGITRARRRAIITYAVSRRVYGFWQDAVPSRFIGELPDENVEDVRADGRRGRSRRRQATPARDSMGQWDAPDRRARSRQRQNAGASYSSTARPAPKNAFTVGQRVFHQKFGYGLVSAIEGDALVITFEKAGSKRVIHSFVEAA
ncbi:MAG: UvrD-helicase domain-containing protein, partial [Rhodospirillales bacterium]|nr:UvrD-helicase domain-containing protein [Rhodospirillales bacterium]